MVKHKVLYGLPVVALAVGAGFLAPMGASAEGEGCFLLGDTSYAAFSDARNAAEDGDTITLTCDVEQDKYYGVTKDLTFDLNNHTYRATKDTAGTGAFQVANGKKFTVTDNSEGGKGKISAVNYGIILFSGGELTLENGEIGSESETDAAIYNSGGSVILNRGRVTTLNGSETSSAAISVTDGSVLVNGSEIAAGAYGVVVWHDADLTMNSGSIVADKYFAITGNGTVEPEKDTYGANTTIAINGGNVRSNSSTAIYHPQKDGILTIGSNAEIYGKKTGVEVRAGTLGISGGSITVDGTTPYDYTANGNGSTTDGVAVAVAQHTTKLPITVTITGGTFTAPVAFSEINPQENSAEDLAKISLSITGGSFVDNDGMGYVVNSEDKTGFISGGEFTKEVNTAYIAEGYDEYDVGPDGPYYVEVATEVNLPEKVYLQVGDSYDLNLSDTAKKYGTLGGAADVVTINEDVITATAVGVGQINFNLHNYLTPVDTNIDAVVYSVIPEPNDDAEAEDRDGVADYAAGLIGQILAGEEVDNVTLNISVDTLKAKLAEGYSLETAVNFGDYINEEDYETTDGYAEIVATITNENEGLVGLLNGEVAIYLVKDGQETIVAGTISQLNSPVTLTATLEDEALVPGDGYDAREFYVLRFHNGTVSKIDGDAVKLDGNYLSFENDGFSTFAIAYMDTVAAADGGDDAGAATTSPDTGTVTAAGASAAAASILTAVAVGVIAAIVGFAVLVRRK